MRLRRLAIMIAIAPLLALIACGKSSHEPKPPLVRTMIVGAAAASTVSYTGAVHARIESALGFEVGGRIVARLVEAGQHVRRGQILMRLDGRALRLAADAAREQTRAARAESLRAVAEEKRLRELVTSGAVSAQRYDDARAAADAATAQSSAAQARAAAAMIDRDHAELRADADGVVAEVLAEPGQVVTAETPVVRLARSGPRELVVDVPEIARPIVPITAWVQPYGGGSPVKAKLRQLSASADPATRTYEARYSLAGGDLALGSTATITLGRDGAGGVNVPIGALHDAGDGPGVWVVPPGGSAVAFRPVRVLRLGDETALIGAGLRKGERIIALGAHLLKQGQNVRLEPRGPAG